MAAFTDAAVFLNRGLELINSEEKWTNHYVLAFELTIMMSKVDLIIWNHDACQQKAKEALFQAETTKMKLSAMLLDVVCCMACNETEATVAAANQALMVLGVQMPCKIGIPNVIAKLVYVRIMLRQKTDEEILNLPRMKDENMITAVRLLLHLNLYYLFQEKMFKQCLYHFMP